MEKQKVINTKKTVIAALFFGAVSFGYAQTKKMPADSAKVGTTAKVETNAKVETTAKIEATGQNPAIEALKTQVAANPNDTATLVKLATAYQDAKDLPNALATWKNISTLLPDWAPGYYSQGYVYQTMKDDANAKAAYEKYISAVKPEELEVNKKNLAYAEFFVAYNLKDTDKEQAKQHIAKSLKYDPMNADAIKLSTFLKQ